MIRGYLEEFRRVRKSMHLVQHHSFSAYILEERLGILEDAPDT